MVLENYLNKIIGKALKKLDMPPAYSFIQQNSEHKYYVTITKFSASILFNVFDNIL